MTNQQDEETSAAEFDINELMDRDPLSLSQKDIEAIVDYQRKYRAKKEGPKPTAANKPELSSLLANLKPKSPAPTKPTTTTKSGIRRV